jgi:hypothetical protein
VRTWATIELDDKTPERARALLSALPQITVRMGERQLVEVDGTMHPLNLLQGTAPYAQAMAPMAAQLTKPGYVRMVVADRLTASVRSALEDAGFSYADGTGSIHLDVPGFLLHIESPRRQSRGVIAAPRGLGAVAVRVVQTLLAEPERDWSVADLVTTSGASPGEAHKVLQRLENEGFLRATGKGPARRRQIPQPSDLLDWLATVPAARKMHARLNAYLYAPNPEQLTTQLSHNAHQSGLTWALTGAAAARVMGVHAVTALPVTMVRVPPKAGLLEAARMLAADAVDSGANLALVADVGAVGTHAATRNGPVAIAPAVRVWLDMLGEPRGEDAAELFRDAVIGY